VVKRKHSSCQFVHEVQELQHDREVNNKYKAKKCIAYFDRVSWAYGDRCNFQHAGEDIHEARVKEGQIELRYLGMLGQMGALLRLLI
jgi:hypothetical protein